MHRIIATAAAAALVVPAAVVAAPAASAAPGRGIPSQSADVVQVPISFQVRNVNRSKVACAADGKTYTVRGHVVRPAHSGRLDRTTTLYLHGLSFGEFFWNYQQSADQNYALQQAERGHTSVVIDRLGYGASDKSGGKQVCIGSRADMATQMVEALRSGRYDLGGRQAHQDRALRYKAPQYKKVVLAGHSYGGAIAQVAAYSFGKVDGLVVMGYADRAMTKQAMTNGAYAASVCAQGGLRVGGTGPTGYAPFGAPAKAEASLFKSASPKTRAAVKQLLTIDPCGDSATLAASTKTSLANVGRIRVPVLVIGGGSDALFAPTAARDQARLYTGSRSVRHAVLPNTGHAFTFEAGRYQLVRTVDTWLDREIH